MVVRTTTSGAVSSCACEVIVNALLSKIKTLIKRFMGSTLGKLNYSWPKLGKVISESFIMRDCISIFRIVNDDGAAELCCQ
mgnify:CR=1 FL=1